MSKPAIQGVQQLDPSGCGVACLAMIAGISYTSARQTFNRLGYNEKRGGKQPYASNFSELLQCLRLHEIEAKQQRWPGWEAISGTGIVKVKQWPGAPLRNWHWVVVDRHPTYGLAIHDPELPYTAYLNPGLGLPGISRYEPFGNWIAIAQENLKGKNEQNP